MEGECEEVIANSWVGGVSLGGKLDSCITKLKSWSQRRLGKVFVELKKKSKALKKLNHGSLTGI